MINLNEKCPCGSNNIYNECCGKFIDNIQIPKTAEELMRSRYSAYTKAKIDYIKETMTGPALKKFNYQSSMEWATESIWLKLEVLNHKIDKKDSNIAYVEFKAFYIINNLPQLLHEKSKFKRINEKWFYYSGDK